VRILFVSHRFPPAHTTGTETYAYNLARSLKARHEVMVFHTDKKLGHRPYSLEAGETGGIETAVLINNLCYDHFTETFENPEAEAAFLQVLDRFAPQVVHIHHLMFSSLQLPRLAKERGIPVVMTLHDFYLICPRGGRLVLPDGNLCPGPEPGRCEACMSTFKYKQSPMERRMIKVLELIRRYTRVDLTPLAYGIRDKVIKKDLSDGNSSPPSGALTKGFRSHLSRRRDAVQDLYRWVDLFMSPSHTVGDSMKSNGLPQEKLRHWPLGIDLEPLTGVHRPKRDKPVFGYFGTLMPHKGVHVLVEAAARNSGRVELLIRGSVAQNPGYARALKQMAASGTRFRPAFGRDAVGEAFSEIDVLVLPSLWLENAPVVIQESFASGCPVVASDCGGMRELVQERVNGRLFSPGDVAALADLLEEVTDAPENVEQWRAGIRPPRSIENDAKSLEVLYDSLQE
jgi:glycosyltransferase involved in cell wall biosynthesis